MFLAASSPSSPRNRRMAETFQDLQNVLKQPTTSHANTVDGGVGRTFVDARSLAVKPDGAPLITYEDRTTGDGPGARGGSSLRGRGLIMRARGRGGRGGRGGQRGGRGGQRGGGKRGGGASSESSTGPEKFEYTEAEVEYMNMKSIKEAGEPVPFEPSDITIESLGIEGPLPAVIAGEVGMTAVVDNTIRVLADRRAGSFDKVADLARNFRKGEFVRFDNDAEKDAVLLRARKASEAEAIRLSERKGEVVDEKDATFETLSEEDRTALLEKLIQGRYSGLGEGQRDAGVLGEIQRVTAMNETYTDRNTTSFVGKVSSMLPARGTARAGASAG